MGRVGGQRECRDKRGAVKMPTSVPCDWARAMMLKQNQVKIDKQELKNLHHWKENNQKYQKCEYQAEGRIFNPVPQLPHEKMENPISPEQEKKDILQLFSGNFSH